MSWDIFKLEKDKSYRLGLCQSSKGRRYFLLIEEEDEISSNKEIVFVTEKVPYQKLRKKDFFSISETISLVNGQRFYVDAHGIWLMEIEIRSLRDGTEFDKVPWVSGSPPKFPEK